MMGKGKERGKERRNKREGELEWDGREGREEGEEGKSREGGREGGGLSHPRFEILAPPLAVRAPLFQYHVSINVYNLFLLF